MKSRSSIASLAILLATTGAATAAAPRPLVLQPAQVFSSPSADSESMGYNSITMEGDWALLTAEHHLSQADWDWDDQALVYHRVNGQWTFDRLLTSDHVGDFSSWVWPQVALKNGIAAVSFNPLRTFRQTGSSWTEFSNPFTAGAGEEQHVMGNILWDGPTLAAQAGKCFANPGSWGTLMATHNADDSWTSPLYVPADPACNLDPSIIAKSGNTLAASAFSNDFEQEPDQVRVWHNNGGSWQQVFKVPSSGEGVGARDPEVFVAYDFQGGVGVYRSDGDGQEADRLLTPSDAPLSLPARRIATTPDYVFTMAGNINVFAKDSAGRYQQVAALVPDADHYIGPTLAVDGRHVLVYATGRADSRVSDVLAYELPVSLATPGVQQFTFQSGNANGWTPTAGSQFAVVKDGSNFVYRQTSLAGDARAVVDDSDWTNQTVTADIRPTAFSGADRWAGLATRYQDGSNFYYVTLRSSGSVQLRRVLNGAITVLASKPMTVTAGQNYHVTLESIGTTHNVYVNGLFVVTAEDSALTHGRAALMDYKTSADFDNVFVQPSLLYGIFDMNSAGCTVYPDQYIITGDGSWTCSTKNTSTRYIIQSSTAGDARAIPGAPTDDQAAQARARVTAFAAPSGTSERWFGLASRYQDASNFYYLSVRSSNTVSLRRVHNGTITVLATAPMTLAVGTWYDLRLEALGSEVRGYVNGRLLVQAHDTTFATGRSGLVTYKAAAEYTGFKTFRP